MPRRPTVQCDSFGSRGRRCHRSALYQQNDRNVCTTHTDFDGPRSLMLGQLLVRRSTRNIPLWERLAIATKYSGKGCWSWTGSLIAGYGWLRIDGKTQLAHRVTYELEVCQITEGMTLDHLCRNRACRNPLHLEQVTLGDNVLRGEGAGARNARKVGCIHGHAFSIDNTKMQRENTGSIRRRCLTCVRETYKRHRNMYNALRRQKRRLHSGIAA